MSHKVTFMPLGRTVEARDGDSILDTALLHDIPLMHACGGFCACTTCHVLVESGAQNLTPMEEEEDDRIDAADGVTERSRLGCQAKIKGDVTVQIMNLDG